MGFFDDDQYGGGRRSWHDVAQICLNGHVINESTKESPEFNQKFCADCGQPTITECQNCKNPIQGKYHMPNFVGGEPMSAPAFCPNCGNPYPWTEAKLKAARELVLEFDGLDNTEKEALSRSLDDLVRDTPSTPVAATRFKKLAVKIGKEGAGALKDIVVDILSETAKKIIWPS
jgi:hypothetical protein